MSLIGDRVRQHGFSLPELLIAAVLGIGVLMAAVELYATAREIERIERAHARVLDQARLARHLITDALHHAGHPGDEAKQAISPAVIPDEALVIQHHNSMIRFFTDEAIGRDNVHSLYRRRESAGGQREELVTGIERLTLRYGLRLDDDTAVDAFVPASEVQDAARIAAVEVRFIVTDIQGVAPRLRYPVTLVVALRNIG